MVLTGRHRDLPAARPPHLQKAISLGAAAEWRDEPRAQRRGRWRSEGLELPREGPGSGQRGRHQTDQQHVRPGGVSYLLCSFQAEIRKFRNEPSLLKGKLVRGDW